MSLKKWAEGDFKSDPQLNLIPTLYMKMKQEGQDFSEPQTTVKREVQFSKDPNVVASQQEADDIAKAIELSLKEKTTSPKAISYSSATANSSTTSKSNPSSLYPSMSTLNNSTNSAATSSSTTTPSNAPEQRKVRALYDFEAAEDNELTFKAGEIIMVFEESDPNWWRGSNHRGEGYFPANFVTADLSMEPEDLTKDTKSSKKNVQFNNENSNEVQKVEQTAVEINEETIDRLLFLLHEADPSDPSQDSDEMLRLENVVNQMGPLIDSELERVDRKHAQLTQLSSDLIDTINLYHSLMQSDNVGGMSGMYGNFPGAPQQMYRPAGAMFSSNNPYNGMPPMNMNMNMNMPMPGPQQMHGFPSLNNNFQAGPPSGNYQQMYQPQQLPSQAMPGQQQQQHQQMPPQMMNPSMTMNQNNMQQPSGVNGGVPNPSQQQSTTLQQQQMPPISHDQQQAMYMHQQQVMFQSPQQQPHGMQPPQSITSPISSANTSMGQFNPSQMQNMNMQHLQQMPGGNMAN